MGLGSYAGELDGEREGGEGVREAEGSGAGSGGGGGEGDLGGAACVGGEGVGCCGAVAGDGVVACGGEAGEGGGSGAVVGDLDGELRGVA